jgi:hypothetical protein
MKISERTLMSDGYYRTGSAFATLFPPSLDCSMGGSTGPFESIKPMTESPGNRVSCDMWLRLYIHPLYTS